MADRAAMKSESSAEVGLVFNRYEFHQICLDVVSGGLSRQIEPPREPFDVCIDNYHRFSEGDSQDNVGGFSADTGNTDHCTRSSGTGHLLVS